MTTGCNVASLMNDVWLCAVNDFYAALHNQKTQCIPDRLYYSQQLSALWTSALLKREQPFKARFKHLLPPPVDRPWHVICDDQTGVTPLWWINCEYTILQVQLCVFKPNALLKVCKINLNTTKFLWAAPHFLQYSSILLQHTSRPLWIMALWLWVLQSGSGPCHCLSCATVGAPSPSSRPAPRSATLTSFVTLPPSWDLCLMHITFF